MTVKNTSDRAVAIVGIGAVLPDAPNVPTFWKNVTDGRYSISEVDRDRWDPDVYWDPNPAAPDKAYSKIGGWCREWPWDPFGWRLPVPPKVADAMDVTQKWAVACTREALEDHSAGGGTLDRARTAVILGNAMAGESHYRTSLRVEYPEFERELRASDGFASLPETTRAEILEQVRTSFLEGFPPITEDTMPGELANCISGRIANLFDFHGPNFVVDAACASAMAAMTAAVEGLEEREFDTVVTGGIDRNMGVNTFVKFCKIGALSATGTRPYGEGADGFVMGEGAVIFVLKRLADAERDGDRIHAVIRGIGGASDGRGKGITAPNPAGQTLAVRRAWSNAGLPIDSVEYVEGHGTSTKVGDVVELEALASAFESGNVPRGAIRIGSVKSNIGHLKGAAGAAGVLKTALALREKVLPPSLNAERTNPAFDFDASPFAVNTTLDEWTPRNGGPRRAGVSAFGFGGTNFHAVLEEHVPGHLTKDAGRSSSISVPGGNGDVAPTARASSGAGGGGASAGPAKSPLRGAVLLGANNPDGLTARLGALAERLDAGDVPSPAPPLASDLASSWRLAIDFANSDELRGKIDKAKKAIAAKHPGAWKALAKQGVFIGEGPPPKVAFLYTGQGSQYVNMLAELVRSEPIVARTFDEANRVMEPLLGRPLTDYIFVDPDDEAKIAEAKRDLMQTAITQPAVLAVDIAITRLLAAWGIEPDMVMGHSLGEYGALVASGAMHFADALEAVSARGREMTRVSVEDNGKMAAVFAPLAEVEKALAETSGEAVIANINSRNQAVIGGGSEAVEAAAKKLEQNGFRVVMLPVSHAFHTSIVAPASGPLRETLERLTLRSPRIPIISNVTGEFYPQGDGVEPEMLDLLSRQVASPVQFVKGLETLHASGARVFVETGPKTALVGFVEDVLGQREGVRALLTNHPKIGDVASANQALCGLWASGLGRSDAETETTVASIDTTKRTPAPTAQRERQNAGADAPARTAGDLGPQGFEQLGRLFADFLDKSRSIFDGGAGGGPARPHSPVVVTGAALGLPGSAKVFEDRNVESILHGDQRITPIPSEMRDHMAGKHVTRLVKREQGEPSFETIDDPAEVIKLAGRGGDLDLAEEYGVSPERITALDSTTRLAIAAGIDALRDAGLPLVMHYRTTSKGTKLPQNWRLPDEMRDDTGVIFASAFPGYDSFAEEITSYERDQALRQEARTLRTMRETLIASNEPCEIAVREIDSRLAEIDAGLEQLGHGFDRRFLFKILAMGHSQFAEEIGARGPNTQLNSACASTTQAISLAEDWIRAGRCKRVVIVAADDATSDNLLEWIGAGFLATGAAAIDEKVEDAALPFDRRRHGMLLGMGAAALVVEDHDGARERGMTPICEVLSSVTVNSAFHGTRLDVKHISSCMDDLLRQAEERWGVRRDEIAAQTVFISHETYTPARGGSAAAEVDALRLVFGDKADDVVVANTKGFTGHPMGVGIEDAMAVKILETGLVPPVPNFRDVDPDLGRLNLSKGGAYPVRYALRLAAGFGSQLSMTLLRWTPPADGARRAPHELGFEYRVADPEQHRAWLARISGQDAPELEVVQHRLRVVDPIASARAAAKAGASTEAPVAATAPRIEAPSTPPAAPQPEPAAASPTGSIETRLLEIVSATTGYPSDMLEMDLDLEADLGIDTVKQAEVFAAVRGEWGIERDENLKLRDFPTLAHVVRFVLERAPGAVSDAAPVIDAASAASATATSDDGVEPKVLEIVAATTGYPTDMLEMDLDLEADLGVDTVKQAEVFAAIRAEYGIERDENLKLRDFPTLDHVVRFVRDRRPDAPAAAATAAPVAIPPAAASPAAAEPAPAAAAPSGNADVSARILSIVAETTGYPEDMLDVELDLEADLGIDTVKQAEIFAAVRAAYGIERDENLKLSDFPTLAHVVRFAEERLAATSGAATVPDDTAPDDTAPDHAAPHDPAPDEVASATSTGDDVMTRLVELVAEKTGYPADMLEPDLDLEADLGIDTVKQAEIFAAMREIYGIERDENLKLRDFPTLDSVARFMRERSGTPGTAEPVSATGAPATASTEGAETEMAASPPDAESQRAPLGDLDAANSVPRRVPVPVWRPTLDVCKRTGVELDEGARVVVVHDAGRVGAALVKRLAKRGVELLEIPARIDDDAMLSSLASFREGGPVTGVYWLRALDPHPAIDELDIEGWKSEIHVRVKQLARLMRACEDDVSETDTFLVAGTRLGGQHGYGSDGAAQPMGGAVSGFVKAYKRERPDALCKAVDFAPSRKTAEPAERLVEETLRDNGAVEIGWLDGERWGVGLREIPSDGSSTGLELGNKSVFVVTGAAGSITSAIVEDLAHASGGVFHLLDLTPEPDPDDPDLRAFGENRDGLKRRLYERLLAAGERATPVRIERELARLERSRSALDAIRAVEAAGGEAHYHSVDLRDPDAVAAAVDAAREHTGRIDVLVHAGGLEISRGLPDKSDDEYDLVFDVKADGWFNLLRAIGDTPLGAAVAFSSVAGRFGNSGQTDYSAANDLLCKYTSSFRNARPSTKGIAIDWTAWGEIGMATRGSIPKMMELAGIDMLPPQAGIPTVRRELIHGPSVGELVVGLRLGILLEPFDEDGGIDNQALARRARSPMVDGRVRADLGSGITLSTMLDPSSQPFLKDHAIDDTPVLPGVMGVEAFASLASLLFPGRSVRAVEDVRFLAPFKFYRSEPREVHLVAHVESSNGEVVLRCSLLGARKLRNANEPTITEHFTARVRLGNGEPMPEAERSAPGEDASRRVGAEDVYRVYFHGPAYRVLEGAWQAESGVIGKMSDSLPPNHVPEDRPLTMAPRHLELVFQTAGMHEIGTKGRMGLPQRVGSVEKLLEPDPSAGPLYTVVEHKEGEGGYDADVVDASGRVYLRVRDYQSVELPGAAEDDLLGPIRDAMNRS